MAAVVIAIWSVSVTTAVAPVNRCRIAMSASTMLTQDAAWMHMQPRVPPTANFVYAAHF
jgi:hypothetical protein